MIFLIALVVRLVTAAWSWVKCPAPSLPPAPVLAAALARPEMRTGGVPLELAMARIGAVFGPCSHRPAVPVDTCLGERVAWLCPACDQRLPARWAA